MYQARDESNLKSINIIQMQQVSAGFKKGVEIIHEVNMSIEKGEFVFLVGPSGAGKTTILRLILREFKPTKGQILIAGYDLSRIRNSLIPYYRRNLGMVFQDFKLLPKRTVAQNIAFSMQVTGAKKSQIRRNVDRILDWTNLTNIKNALSEDISGGEQQRVAIARAMVNDPSIILADEPTGNLDPETSLDIMRLFERFNMRGATILIATHNINLVKQLNKRIIGIEHGKVFEEI